VKRGFGPEIFGNLVVTEFLRAEGPCGESARGVGKCRFPLGVSDVSEKYRLVYHAPSADVLEGQGVSQTKAIRGSEIEGGEKLYQEREFSVFRDEGG